MPDNIFKSAQNITHVILVQLRNSNRHRGTTKSHNVRIANSGLEAKVLGNSEKETKKNRTQPAIAITTAVQRTCISTSHSCSKRID